MALIDAGDLSDAAAYVPSLAPSGVLAAAKAAADLGACDRTFEAALAPAAVKALSALRPSEAADLMHAMASLECYSLDCKDALADAVLSRLPEYSGHDLGKTLRAFATLGYWDSALLEGVAEDLSKRTVKLTPREIADIVYAYSKCGYCHPALLAIVDEAAASLGDPAEDRGASLACVLDAVSRVGCEVTKALEKPILEAAQHAADLSPEALAEIAACAIKLGYEDESMILPLLDALANKLAASEGLDTIPPKDIVKLVKSLAGIQYPHPKLLSLLADVLIPARINEFSDTGLVELTDAFNNLSVSSPAFLAAFRSRVKP